MTSAIKFMRVAAVTLVALAAGGCTITQTVNPTTIVGDEICIVENPKVREGFLPAMQQALKDNGYRYRMLSAHASDADCADLLRYVARWSWDLTIYMSYAKLDLFRNGQLAGDALYDATKGGGNLSKFIDAEPKIAEIVGQLLPRRTASISAASAASLATVSVEEICTQSSKVDKAECRGLLKLGMSRDETLQVLGRPDGKSADEQTLRFGDRYLNFSEDNRLVQITEAQ